MSARAVITSQCLRSAVIGPVSIGRNFSFTTSRALGLKESSNQSGVDYDKHKADSLAKQKQGKGQWKPELATDSEEAIRADRDPSTPGETARLQEQTKRAAKKTARAGGH